MTPLIYIYDDGSVKNNQFEINILYEKNLTYYIFLFTIISHSQCNDGEYEILFETFSGEWARNNMVYY